MLEDIAVVTGADFISEDIGRKLESVDVNSLGQSVRALSQNDRVIGLKGSEEGSEKRLNEIKSQIQKTGSDLDEEKLQERLGKLSGGVAVIRVGAATEVEQKENQRRIEDAVAAKKAASGENSARRRSGVSQNRQSRQGIDR